MRQSHSGGSPLSLVPLPNCSHPSLGGEGRHRIHNDTHQPGSGKLNKSQIIWEHKRGTRTVQGDPGSRCLEPGRRGRARGVGRALQSMEGTNPRREETGNHKAGPTSQESQGCPEYFLPGPVLAAHPPASFILNQRATRMSLNFHSGFN